MALVLSFTLTAPLFAVSAATTVPVCCRRGGAHHCMSMVEMNPDANAAVAAVANRCPRLPVTATAPQTDGFVARWTQSSNTPLFARPAALPQTEARYRVSYARSRQKRGPPVCL